MPVWLVSFACIVFILVKVGFPSDKRIFEIKRLVESIGSEALSTGKDRALDGLILLDGTFFVLEMHDSFAVFVLDDSGHSNIFLVLKGLSKGHIKFFSFCSSNRIHLITTNWASFIYIIFIKKLIYDSMQFPFSRKSFIFVVFYIIM